MKCLACEEMEGRGEYYQVRRGRYVWKGDHLILMPGLGPVVPDYLILQPIRHFTSFSDVPEEVYGEMDEILSRLEGRWMVAEHGERERTLEHAHLHVFRLSRAWKDEFLNKVLGECQLIWEGDIRSPGEFYREKRGTLRAHREYLVILDLEKKRGYILAHPGEARQYIRRVLASISGVPWDWKVYPGEENMERILREFSNLGGNGKGGASAPGHGKRGSDQKGL